MQYRRFGRTEIQMPVISTGGMRYQDGWKDKPLAEVDPKVQANLEATIQHSLQVGIHHIETARGYGVSERQLGTVLPQYPREKLIVQTKIEPTEDVNVFLQHFEESLERLQLDHVDLLGLHGLNTDERIDWAVNPGGCLEAARDLQKQGKVRHVGFSTHAPLKQIMRAVQTDVYGGFDYMNLHYYYIFQRNWPAIVEATKRDMGVFIISPSDKGGKLYAPPQKLTDLCAPLHPIVFNDLWCLLHPEIHTLSLGSARPSDYDLHIQAVELLDEAQKLVAPITAKLQQAMHDAIGHNTPEAFSWDGVPEHYDTPEDLNIPLMLWLGNVAKGWDMVDYAKMRFNLLGNANHWFPGSKPETFNDIPIQTIEQAISDSPHAKQIPELLKQAIDLLSAEAVQRQSQS